MHTDTRSTEERLKEVCAQRDRMSDALDRLIGAFWSAHYNGAFDAEDTKKDKDGKEYRCSAGKSLNNVFHGCDKFGTEECKGFDCPMGYHHHHLYELVQKGTDALHEPKAEYDGLDIARIPEYDPGYDYVVEPSWFARMALMFFYEFRLSADYTEDGLRKFDRALWSLMFIGLAALGYKSPVRLDDLTNECVPDEPKYATFREGLEKVLTKGKETSVTAGKEGRDWLRNFLSSNSMDVLEYLVAKVVLFRLEFEFGHEYPGADMGVYSDVAAEIKWLCATKLGFSNDFDAIQNMNDTGLDTVGFVASCIASEPTEPVQSNSTGVTSC